MNTKTSRAMIVLAAGAMIGAAAGCEDVPEEDIFKDRMLLWDQLNLLRPEVMLCQGVEAYEMVRHMCRDKFPHNVVLQKIGQYQKKEAAELEISRVTNELRAALPGRD